MTCINVMYQVSVFFKVPHSRPGGNEELRCFKGSPGLGEQSSDVVTSLVE